MRDVNTRATRYDKCESHNSTLYHSWFRSAYQFFNPEAIAIGLPLKPDGIGPYAYTADKVIRTVSYDGMLTHHATDARLSEFAVVIMLVSHCGEYMANGLTNAVRHEFVMIANDRQTFVAVRKHSRSFLWCFECYAGLTSGECRPMANGLTNAIRHQFAMIAK